MFVVITDENNGLIACIDATGKKEQILKNGYKFFIAPKVENITFIDPTQEGQDVECYPKIILRR